MSLHAFFLLLVSLYIHRARKPTEGGVCYQVKASLVIYVDGVSQVKIGIVSPSNALLRANCRNFLK